MAKTLTLIVIARDRLIRAEFDSARAAEPSFLEVQPRNDVSDSAALVSNALRWNQRKPGNVVVLSVDFWTHTTQLPTSNIHGMSHADLTQMIGFEVEPLSNIATFDAATSVLPLNEQDGIQNYWVTQIAASQRDQVDAAVRAAGGKLLGLAHPGGVPLGLRDATSPIGARVEFWPGHTVRTAYGQGRVRQARIDDVISVEQWQQVATRWYQETNFQGQIEILSPQGAAVTSSLDAAYLTLDDPATLSRWLSAWNQALRAKQPAVPLIGRVARPVSDRTMAALAVALAAIAVAVCYFHDRGVRQQTTVMEAEKKQLEAPAKQLATIKTEFTAIEKTLKTAREERDKLAANVQSADAVLDSHRQRLTELLKGLRDHASDDWVVQKIAGNGRDLIVTGVSRHPEKVGQIAVELSQQFASLNWAVDPPKQNASNLLADGGPWTFEMHVRDLQEAPPKKAKASSKQVAAAARAGEEQ